ncbi:MAG TPA: hypothetical protein PLI97_11645 [Fluviicola sp.]|nr:hypothetical protein [Fluviicola sp.]
MIHVNQIIDISKKHVRLFENTFHSLTETGKLEALIYNVLICNFSLQSRYSMQQVEELNFDIFALLIGELKMHIDETDDDALGFMIEKCFAKHTKDIVMILDEGAKFDPMTSYKSFVVSPFKPINDPEVAVEEMSKFKTALVQMTNAVLTEIDAVPD